MRILIVTSKYLPSVGGLETAVRALRTGGPPVHAGSKAVCARCVRGHVISGAFAFLRSLPDRVFRLTHNNYGCMHR